ncbi:MAG TPA: universal stress protein [Gaiellaceae bacterium]|nr:universal stress protein [Gaiellaceae bacterium]
MKNILIATDGSAGALVAVAMGAELARDLGGTASVVYVRPTIGALGDPFYQRKLTEQMEEAEAALAAARAEAGKLGVSLETDVLEGDAADTIVEIARLRGADVIAVGSRGLGAVTGALLGSVSSAIVHKADRPVLVVKDEGGA